MLHSHGEQVMLSIPNHKFKAEEEPEHSQQLQCRLSLPLSSLLMKEKSQREQPKERKTQAFLLCWLFRVAVNTLGRILQPFRERSTVCT